MAHFKEDYVVNVWDDFRVSGVCEACTIDLQDLVRNLQICLVGRRTWNEKSADLLLPTKIWKIYLDTNVNNIWI